MCLFLRRLLYETINHSLRICCGHPGVSPTVGRTSRLSKDSEV